VKAIDDVPFPSLFISHLLLDDLLNFPDSLF
jgi:hypothetical protein